MQEKGNHFQNKASKKEYKVRQQREQRVKKDQHEEWENEQEEVVESSPAESSSNTCPSRKIIDNEIYEPTNIQLDPEQVDIARQQYLGNNAEIYVPVGFGLVALINEIGCWVFRRVSRKNKQKQITDISNVEHNNSEQTANKKEIYLKKYPLHYAVAQGDLDKVKEILQSKTVEVDTKDHNNFTPLHIAAGRENYELVIELLLHGADPNAQDDEGSTPMHSAAEGNNLKLLKCLVKNKYGKIMEWMLKKVDPDSREASQSEIKDILREHGSSYVTHRELLLVASNQEHPQEVEIWLQHLKQFAEEPDCRKKIYKKLVKLAIKNTCFFIERKLEEDKKQK
ncbi:2990_t:CDS:2, partial [Cetraspora pellucida]